MISVLTHVGKAYWFVDVYIVLMLIAPMLNSFIDKMSSRQLACIVAFLLFYAWSSICIGSQQFRGNCPESFVNFYLIGRLIRRLNDERVLRRINSSICILLYTALSVINVIVFVCLESKFGVGALTFGYESPIVLLMSCLLLITFIKIEFRNRVVNYMASAAFAMYLLHMHWDVKQWYYEYSSYLYSQPVWNHIYSLIILFTAIFVIAFLLDKLRELSFKYVLISIKSLRKL